MATEQDTTPDWEAQAQANAMAAGVPGGTAGDKIDSMPVFVIGSPVRRVQTSRETAGKGLPDSTTVPVPLSTVGVESGKYFSWDYETRQQFINTLKGLGQDTSKMNDSDFAAAWRAYVIQAAQHKANGKDITPWSVMTIDLFTRETERQKQVEKGPVTATSTSTGTTSDVQLSTELDAKALLYQASKSLLGRAPTDTEVSNFFTSLNQEESANPQVTTTNATRTVTSTEGIEGGPGPSQTEETTQDRVTSGGMSADAKQMLVMEEAKKNPEYGAYQAATTFKDALMDMVYGKGY